MFTREQILEIQQKLASNGYKDSDFEIVDGLDGTEYVAVIKNGTNKRVLVGTLNDYIIENANVPTKLSQLQGDSTHRLVTDTEKTTWNAKYKKPSSGIPATDIARGVIPDVSDFITRTVANLAYYYTKSETYTRQQIQSLISQIHSFTIEVVNSLPTASASTMYKIYLVPSQNSETQNVKDEYITLETTSGNSTTYSWELIGSTAIDLSGYVTTTALANALLNYQAMLISGTNIKTINGESILGEGDMEIEGSEGSSDAVLFTEQTLTSEQQAQARSNIGAGTSNFSGNYNDLNNKPTIPAAQVNSDWNAASGVAQILNKPTIPEAQIQSDWEQSDNTKKDYIKNKPTIPAAQVQSDWSQSDSSAVDFIKNKPTELELTSQIIDALWAAAS